MSLILFSFEITPVMQTHFVSLEVESIRIHLLFILTSTHLLVQVYICGKFLYMCITII